eukprot:gene2548-2789_t
MPQFVLKVKADLDNIRALIPVEGNLWKFDIQTPGGGDERKGVTVSTEESFPLEGSRGEANFLIKWPHASDQAYIKILTQSRAVAKEYSVDDGGSFVTILALECRGLEVTAWHPSFDFDVESIGGTVFKHNQVDLSDRDWTEYDEENDLSVSVLNLDYRIDVAPSN